MHKRHYAGIIVILVLCFGTLLLLFDRDSLSAAPGDDPSSAFRIEVILKARANPPDFWRVVEQGVAVAAEEQRVVCNITAPQMEKDIDDQIELVEQAIARSPDAIILAACDYDRLRPVCEQAVEKGILLVTLDSDVNYEGRRCFISTDNYEIGRKLALLVDVETGEADKFGVVGHVASTSTAVERRDGLLENVEGAGGRLAAIAYCESSEELAEQRAMEMLREHPDIKCMVGLNESSAIGVAEAVSALGRGQIPVIACDSSQRQIEFMESGIIKAFVIQNPFNMGYLAVTSTVKLLRGESVPAVVHTESVVIRKEDLYSPQNQKLLFPFTGDEK